MKLRHAAALALLGWVLVVIRQQPNGNWEVFNAGPATGTQQDCEKVKKALDSLEKNEGIRWGPNTDAPMRRVCIEAKGPEATIHSEDIPPQPPGLRTGSKTVDNESSK